MTTNPIRARIAQMVEESADDHGVIEPNAEQMGGALTAVLDHLDTYAVRIRRDGDPMVVVADLSDLLSARLGVMGEGPR